MFTLRLLAQQQPARNLFDTPEFIWATAGLAGALVVGAVAMLLVDRWRKKGLAASARSVDELTEYRALYESGEITEDEYKKLRAQLADRVKHAADLPAKDPETAAPSPLVNGLPRVKPPAPPAPPPDAKPWDTPRRESDPPA